MPDQQPIKGKKLRAKNQEPKYRVSRSGSIVDPHGAVLYESGCISDLSPEAKTRLAQLHSDDPLLEWEGDGSKPGAWSILIAEHLMPDDR